MHPSSPRRLFCGILLLALCANQVRSTNASIPSTPPHAPPPSNASQLSNPHYKIVLGLVRNGLSLTDTAFLRAIPEWCIRPEAPQAVLQSNLVFVPIVTNESEIATFERLGLEGADSAVSFIAVFDPAAAACAHRTYPLFTANEAGRIWPPPTSASSVVSYTHPQQTREIKSGCLYGAACARGLAGTDCNYTVAGTESHSDSRGIGAIGVVFASVIAVSIVAATALAVIRGRAATAEAVEQSQPSLFHTREATNPYYRALDPEPPPEEPLIQF
jgi:hypothetical protein